MDAPVSNFAEHQVDREIVISRVVDAPRELVWEAWTDAEQVARWWGPEGFTTTIERMDVQPGGVWKHVMHGPDGTDYPNGSVFFEVVKPERIVYSHGGRRPGGPGVSFEATWTFEAEEDERTRVTIRMVFLTAAERDMVVREYDAINGGRQTLDRLARELAGLKEAGSGNSDFVIMRRIAAAPPRVFAAWTEARQLARWWGPHGVTCPVCEVDPRPGGAFRIVMRARDGMDYPLTGVFSQVIAPECIVSSVDTREHPPAWHEQLSTHRPGGGRAATRMQWTILFAERGGATNLMIRTGFESPADREAFLNMGMADGWSQSLERLESLVAKG